MYTIFFHVSGLALIEIIFYFTYIGPMETRIFHSAITHVDHNSKENEFSNIHIVDPYNQSHSIDITVKNEDKMLAKLKYLAMQSEKERNKSNAELYHKTIVYWCCLMSFSLFVFIVEISVKYYLHLKSKQSIDRVSSINTIDIEMTSQHEPLRNRIRTDSINYEDDILVTDDDKFFDCKKIYKTVMITSVYYTILTGFILGFEYLFFTYIILKYKIISQNEMKYALYQLVKYYLQQYLNDYVHDYTS